MTELNERQTYYYKNRERILAERKRRYLTNPKAREYCRRYRQDPANRAKVAARSKALYQARKQGIVLPRKKRGKPADDPARNLVVLKLRRGDTPLTPKELGWVLPGKRAEAAKLKPRTLQAVGDLFGLTRERVRQIVHQLEQ